MTPDQIIAAGVRNWQRRQEQIARLLPRQADARQKHEEMRERAESMKDKTERAETFQRLRTIPNFFPTPGNLAEQMIELADLRPGLRVLEPSCGKADIAKRIRAAGCIVECVELVHELAEISRGEGLTVRCDDFLTITPSDYGQRFDRVIMNPPFERGACLRHTLHAYEFLAAGGELVAIVSSTTGQRLEDWADHVEPLPAGSFECSERPTSVNTALIRKTK